MTKSAVIQGILRGRAWRSHISAPKFLRLLGFRAVPDLVTIPFSYTEIFIIYKIKRNGAGTGIVAEEGFGGRGQQDSVWLWPGLSFHWMLMIFGVLSMANPFITKLSISPIVIWVSQKILDITTPWQIPHVPALFQPFLQRKSLT